MLGTDGKVLTWSLKRQILAVVRQNCETSIVKHSIEISMLLNFYLVCLNYFVQGCLKKHIFISNSVLTPYDLSFGYSLAFDKTL